MEGISLLFKCIAMALLVAMVYLLFWPVSVDPVAWNAPPNPGYQAEFEANTRLADLELFSLQGLHGPEDIALDESGRVYASTGEGYIVRLDPKSRTLERWVNTQGRPLGIEFDANGKLIVADAYKGLLSIDPAGNISVLSDQLEGSAIRYADDLDIADDGIIYFSDASTKFGAREYGGAFEASLLDVLEHGGHGRLLRYDPLKGETQVVVEGINFANGVAVSHDQRSVLLNETGSYRVLKISIVAETYGKREILLDDLPGFPDNLSRGLDGRYWLGLIAPRSALLDKLSDQPFLRKIVQRLPPQFRPKALPYAHVIALNEQGDIEANYQAPQAQYSHVTGVTETRDWLYVSNLMATSLGRLKSEF